MHELSIASNIVDSVLREMQRRHIDCVAAIGLRIGRMTDVDADALTFGFEIITKGTPLAGARLAIEHIPIQAHCQSCEKDFEVNEFQFVCPSCGSGRSQVLRGTELDITYLEIDEETPAAQANTEAD